MKRLLAFLLLLAPFASAQVVVNPGGGGSATSSGSTISGCTSSILYADAGSLLKCDPAAVVNGSVSTAGRSILTIRDSISGSSATSNFLNITGSFPATLSADTAGVVLSLTGDNDDRLQVGLDNSFAGAVTTGNNNNYSFRSTFTGTTNNGFNISVFGSNTGTSNSSGYGVGVVGEVFSNNASKNFVGVWGGASSINAGSGKNIGVYGITGANATPTYSIGVLGGAGPGTNRFGGYFAFDPNTYTSSLITLPPSPTGTAALVADNSSVAANIFEARDNGTAVFTIADGGTSTFTQGVNVGGYLHTTGSGLYTGVDQIIDMNGGATVGGLSQRSAFTPDAMSMYVGTSSNSVHINEYNDISYDFQNACTTGLGTAACTDPTLIVHSHNQDTGEFLSMAHDGKAGVIAGGNSTVLDGTIRLGGTVTLTESSATAVLTVPVAVSTGTGGEIIYTVEARDATNTQIRAGKVLYAVANNSGGTETCNVFGISTTQAVGGDTTNAANPTQVQDGSGVGAITSGTLTYAWSVDTTGSNQCVLKLNAVSSLTQTTLQVHYTVIQSGPGVSTGGD